MASEIEGIYHVRIIWRRVHGQGTLYLTAHTVPVLSGWQPRNALAINRGAAVHKADCDGKMIPTDQR